MTHALQGSCSPTLARALLACALDGADALMMALIQGSGTPLAALTLLLEALDGPAGHAQTELDRLFTAGATHWGRRVQPQGMQSFHRACSRWKERLEALPSRDCDALRAWLSNDGRFWLAGPDDAAWPAQLDDLSTRGDWAPPLCLWGMGSPVAPVACEAPVAVVGSRGVNGYGRQVTTAIAENAASRGHVVVSGGAMGTDACAHWGALHARDRLGTSRAGPTVAFFAGGLNHVGPASNARLFDAMLAAGGALLSECPPGTVPQPHRFLLRNRLIAAMASTVVVAQARRRSGALNTAHWGNELNRTVYAVPGCITTPEHAGCHELIRNQEALLLADPAACDEWTHAAHPPGTAPDAESPAEGNEEGDWVAEALSSLRSQGRPPTPNAVARLVLERHPERFPDLTSVHVLLGRLELEGTIRTGGTGIAMAAST